jgi:hypothetical protein
MINKNLSEMNENEIQITNNIVFRTQDRLLNIYAGVTERALKALFLINGGGVVAMLAYLNDSATATNNKMLVALGCFLTGLVFTVLVVAVDYYVCFKSLNNYSANLRRFNRGEIKLEETQNYSSKGLSDLTVFTVFSGYFAAVLFLTGCACGVMGYFTSLAL